MTISHVNCYEVRAAWNRAVAAYRACWSTRRALGYDDPATRQAEDEMHAASVEASRISGWTMIGPSGVACGGCD